MAGFDGFMRRHFAEASLFLYTFGVVMQWPVTQNLLLDKSCRGSFSQEVCASLSDHPEIEEAVQAASVFWLTTLPSITGVITAFSSLLLGSASDRFGRGRVVMFTCVGGVILSLTLILQTGLSHLSAPLLLIGTVAIGSSGGILTFMATLFDFITDNTPADQRTGRLSLVQPFAGLGMVFGMLLSGVVSKHLGFRAVYIIFLSTQTAVLIMAAKYMRDSGKATRKPGDSGTTPAGQPGLVASVVESLTAGARVCLKSRPGNERKHVLFLILIGVVTMIGVGGDIGVTVLYTRRAPFHWEQTTFGYFVAAKNVGQVLGMALGTRVLLRLIGTGTSRDDLTLMQIGQLAVIAGTLTMSSATNSFHLALVPLLCVLSGPSQAAGGSFSSKLVHPTEKGAFSAFSSFINNLAMPAGTLAFSTIYSWTSTSSVPGLVFIVKAAMYTIPLVLITLMKRDMTKAD